LDSATLIFAILDAVVFNVVIVHFGAFRGGAHLDGFPAGVPDNIVEDFYALDIVRESHAAGPFHPLVVK
jgi:hypothetical protein